MSSDKYRVRLSPQVHVQAKAEAALLDIPLARFVTDALVVAIETARKARHAAGAGAEPRG